MYIWYIFPNHAFTCCYIKVTCPEKVFSHHFLTVVIWRNTDAADCLSVNEDGRVGSLVKDDE